MYCIVFDKKKIASSTCYNYIIYCVFVCRTMHLWCFGVYYIYGLGIRACVKIRVKQNLNKNNSKKKWYI